MVLVQKISESPEQKLDRWEEVYEMEEKNSPQVSFWQRLKTDISNFQSYGADGITETYENFHWLMRSTMVYQTQVPQNEWLNCLVEIGQYIIYLEANSTQKIDGFQEFCTDMQWRLNEEMKDSQQEGFNSDSSGAQIPEMLCRLKNL